jgi:serine/threonine-protein kinase
MEYLEGETLRAKMARGPLGAAALSIARQIALALARAHEGGIVHRDLKPANVMLVPHDERPGEARTKVLDFGLARLAHPEDDPERRVSSEGVTLGTVQYMAPEQCRAERDLDGKADVYALGIMLYEMLSGRLPFVASSPYGYMDQHVTATPAPLSQAAPSVPAEVSALVAEMLAKAPAARPAMAEVARRLEPLLSATGALPAAPERRRRTAALSAGLLLAAALAAALLAAGRQPASRPPAPEVPQPASPAPAAKAAEPPARGSPAALSPPAPPAAETGRTRRKRPPRGKEDDVVRPRVLPD